MQPRAHTHRNTYTVTASQHVLLLSELTTRRKTRYFPPIRIYFEGGGCTLDPLVSTPLTRAVGVALLVMTNQYKFPVEKKIDNQSSSLNFVGPWHHMSTSQSAVVESSIASLLGRLSNDIMAAHYYLIGRCAGERRVLPGRREFD